MSKTLLLADDSVVIQKLVGLSFANEAVTLITTDNGDDAVTRAREAKPDLILADVVMPGLNGYEVCEAIKQDPELSHIPVLLLTGTFEAFDDARAAEVGSCGHITKPFEAQVLVERVNEMLAQGAGSPAAATPMATPAQSPAEDAGYEFFEGEPDSNSPVITEALSVPSADPSPVDDFSAADEAFSFDHDAAELEPLDAGDFERPAASDPLAGSTTSPQSEPGGDRTVAMILDAPAPAGSPMDFDALDEAPFNDPGPPERSDSDDFSSLDPPELAATELVSDPFGDGEPDLSFHDDIVDTSVSSSLSFGSPESGPLSDEAGNGGETLLAQDLFSDSENALAEEGGWQSGTTDPQGITPATPIDELDLADCEAPLLESSQPGIEAIDEATPFEALPIEGAGLELSMQNESSSGSAEAAEEWMSEVEPAADFPSPDRVPAPPATPELESIPLATESATAMPDLSPMLRERLHESMEKIAWEAFADVSDQIVKQALERIESVAWEVIPQMAEAMIREEIRRMKGDPEE